ncbi:MAG: hypothetical protein B6245_01595 [Desulfobacteraceae bacterium 4572_88]|nr:MAG: hypothetical protein B6245_01595 [Desulfobacteraceae bacterium 4572_88]
MPDKNVLVIGGGVAGLSAAIDLARLGVGVELVEKADALGGHARQFSCKATEKCVRCGACVVEEKLRDALEHSNISVSLNSEIQKLTKSGGRFSAELQKKDGESRTSETDAIILATGFRAFDPENKKPYGYKLFDNVITNLELERMLREKSIVSRPSDQQMPKKIAFVQCVGSRDSKLGNLWCSKICCGSALRMARLIKMRQPETEITFFHIDVQTFGRDFQTFYEAAQNEVRMVRAIPGDVFKTDDDGLKVSCFDNSAQENVDEIFDLLVLSVGITPGRDTKNLSALLNLKTTDTGFFEASQEGIFTAGAALGPMSIAEAVASAGYAACEALNYLDIQKNWELG